MDVYRQMLEGIGIFDERLVDEPPPPPPLSPCPSCTDELFWDVRDNLGSEFHLDYDQEISYAMNCKKLHRYSRKDRFKFILYQLLGMSGETPSSVVRIIKQQLPRKISKHKIWNEIRGILKKNNLRKYYNRIPGLINQISNSSRPIGINSEKIQAIILKFSDFDYQFNNHLRIHWDRHYFPNLRFIALKLIEQFGITFPYKAPLVRTSRKKKYLEKLFAEFE